MKDRAKGGRLVQQLLEATRILAAPPEAQAQHLTELGVAPLADELALEYADVAGAVVANPGLLTTTQTLGVLELDRLLSQLSGSEHAEQWTIGALHTADEWAEIRRLAQQVVDDLS